MLVSGRVYSNLKSRNEFMPPFTFSFFFVAGDYIPKDPCMYGIFTYIYHKNQPNVGNLILYMDFMGMMIFGMK